MTREIRSEFIKLTSIRTSYLLVAAGIGIGALAGLVTIQPVADGEWVAMDRHPFLVMFLPLITAVAFVLGARPVTDEFAHKTMIWTVLASPRRWKSIGAKAITGGLGAGVMGALALATTSAIALVWSAGNADKVTLHAADVVPLVAAMTAICALYAAIGAGLGSVVRHQVGTAVAGVVWILVGEGVLGGLLKDARRFLPGDAAAGLFGVGSAELVSGALGAVLLVCYAALAVAAGMIVMRTRDIA